jgi:hypothetical protein
MKNPNPDPLQHGSIPIWNAENWFYEDIQPGKRIRSIRRTISEGESMLFNSLVLDMHPYVGDEIFAREQGIFGKRLVAGAMVFSLGLGLVATNCVNAFSYGYDKLRFIKPIPSRLTWIKAQNIQPWACTGPLMKYSKMKASWCCTANTCKPCSTGILYPLKPGVYSHETMLPDSPK